MPTSNLAPPPQILLAVDGSSHATAAVNLLTHITWPAGTSARIVSLVPERLPRMETEPESRGKVDETAELKRWRDWSRAKIITGEAADKLRSHQMRVETEICEGDPAEVIMERSLDLSADLTIVGAKGRHASPEFRLGSTASKLAQHAPDSVLVVRPTAQIRPLPTVVVVDDSPKAWRAVKFLCHLSLPDWAAVTAANVVEKEIGLSVHAGAIAPAPQPINRGTAEVVDYLHQCGVQVRPVVRFGSPAEEILAIAEEHEAALIVIGVREQARSDQTRMEEVAQTVVEDAACSVLTIR